MDYKLVIFLIAIGLSAVQTANILGYIVRNSMSHFLKADVLLRALAENGHNVCNNHKQINNHIKHT